MLVDQCVSEVIICLYAVPLWDGRWDGYPYPPSGQAGTDELRLWPRVERDQRITVLHTVLNTVAIFYGHVQIMSVCM